MLKSLNSLAHQSCTKPDFFMVSSNLSFSWRTEWDSSWYIEQCLSCYQHGNIQERTAYYHSVLPNNKYFLPVLWKVKCSISSLEISLFSFTLHSSLEVIRPWGTSWRKAHMCTHLAWRGTFSTYNGLAILKSMTVSVDKPTHSCGMKLWPSMRHRKFCRSWALLFNGFILGHVLWSATLTDR